MEDIIILIDENGEEQEYELLDTVEYEGEQYVVLIRDEEDSVVILKVESEEDEELSLISCEDDVIEEVYHIFKEKNTDNFDFEDRISCGRAGRVRLSPRGNRKQYEKAARILCGPRCFISGGRPPLLKVAG